MIAFCAGADLRDLAAAGAGDMSGALRVYHAFGRVAACPLPTIAAVNGPAVGAGVNLALACDVRAVVARFDCRFPSLGLHPGGGNTRLLQRRVGPQTAAAMVLFGQTLDGEQAARADLRPTALDLARRAASTPGDLPRETKETLQRVQALGRYEDALRLATERQARSVVRPAAKDRVERRWPALSRGADR